MKVKSLVALVVAIGIVFSMLIGATGVSAVQSESKQLVISGDFDGSGSVTARDAVYLVYYTLFGGEDYPLNCFADLNGDGKIDFDDAIYLLYNSLYGDKEYPKNESAEPTVMLGNVEGKAGDEVEISLNMANSPEMYAMSIKLNFDDTCLTLVSAESGNGMQNFTYTGPGKLKNGSNFIWYTNDPSMVGGCVLKLVFKISENASAGNYSIKITNNVGNTYDKNDNDVSLEFVNGSITVSN